jgi:16S rRNA processing protein RimM
MIRVGQVMGAFGLGGAVKVSPLTDFDDRFAPGSELQLAGATRRVEWSRRRPAGFVIKLSELDSRTIAEMYRGHYLEVEDGDLRPLPAGRWYHHQLVGLNVSTEGGRELGVLNAVLERPANDVWVAHRDGVEYLIPATQDAVIDVDLEAGRVTVADWLLDADDG